MSSTMQAIVLAAGKSSRFNTSKTKLSHTLCGQEMLLYPLKALEKLSLRTLIVLGHQKEQLLPLLSKEHSYYVQAEQKGTGHALLCTKDLWISDHILVLNGDMPLVTPTILESLINAHIDKNSTVSFIVAHNADPSLNGYGRVLSKDNKIEIIEAREFNGDTQEACYVNAGIYIFKRAFLEKNLPTLAYSKSGELYITDLIKKANLENEPIELVEAEFDSIRGINTLQELWVAEHIKRSELIRMWMARGVRFMAPQNVHIDLTVTIGSDSIIGAGVQLRGTTTIGTNCLIDAHTIITNATIDDNVIVHPHSVISDSQIHKESQIGPFAHIHNKTIVLDKSNIGNFVELTRSTIGNQTKVKHLAYVGDAFLHARVNVGAGTVVCNYNGISKNVTIIEEGAQIGSNSCLIAPLTIGKESVIGAGSVITKNVPDDSLSLSRAEQVIKENYAPKLKHKYAQLKQKQSEGL